MSRIQEDPRIDPRIKQVLQGNYCAWGRIIAARGVTVAMVDFRNPLTPSSVPEIEPFPAALNAVVLGLDSRPCR